MFAALGRFDYRFRRWLPLVALALVIGLNIWVTFGGGKLIQGGWNVPGSEALRAEELLADRFGVQATAMIVVYRDPAKDAGSAAFQKQVAASVSRVADDPVVDDVLTYATVQDPKFLSRDGSATFALIRLTEQDEAAVDDAQRLANLVETPPGVETYVTGVPQVYHEFNAKIESDLFQAEAISLPIALLILLAVFGTLVGASLPMLMAALALPSAFAVIGLLASVTEMSIFVTNIATMIGLALAIDYSLFMVSRFREELRHHPVDVAVERMMASVGKAVAVSGIAVAIGLSALIVFESPALRSMGIAGVITVVSTLVFALTVLPALLGMLGHRVNRLRVPLPRALRLVEDDTAAADRRQGHGVWAWGRVARDATPAAHRRAGARPAARGGLPIPEPPAVDRRKPRRPAPVAGAHGLRGPRGRVPRWRHRPDRGRGHLSDEGCHRRAKRRPADRPARLRRAPAPPPRRQGGR